MTLRKLFLVVAAMTPFALRAQISPETPGWFPFTISGLDDSQSVLDLSFLNPTPAGTAGFVSVKGDHIIDGAGRPLRWMGVNIVASACFPTKADAPKIAGHLAKMGVNIIRFHFLDNQWGQIGLLKKPEYREWDAEAFDRWDFFVSELKKRGIYANINLHVGRTYEGTPKDAPHYSKGLDQFHRPFIDALKDYSRTLFEHRNPYTGNTYKEEPCVGCVEINNENSLVLNPWWIVNMPEPFVGEFRHLWNDWLGGHFGTTENVRHALGVSDGKLGPNLIGNPRLAELQGWRLDRPDPEKAMLEAIDGGGARWTVKKRGDVPWFHQLNFGKLTLENGKRYRLSFRARAQTLREKLSVSVMQDGGEYKQCGLGGKFDASPDKWRDFSFDGEVHDALPGRARVSFNIDNQPDVYEIDDVRLQVVPTEFLRPDQSVEADNIPLPERATSLPVRRAFFEFLGDLEISYAGEIRDFLKHECGVRVPIAYSQVLFGGIMGARREQAVSDFVDTHGYWQHPHFPNKPWDMKDWEIGNTTQLASKEGGTLLEMAVQRPFGKPYTCSEYDIPAPNDFAAESWPMLASLAAAQDWSGIYIYNYCDDNAHWDTNKIDRFFSTLGHPAKQALMPWSALVFRQKLLKPATASTKLELSDEVVLNDAAESAGDVWGSWRRVWKSQTPNPVEVFQRLTGLQIGGDQPAPRLMVTEASEGPMQSVQWDVQHELFQLDAPGAVLLLGKLGTHDLKLAGFHVDVPPLDGNGHGCIAIASMDGAPLRNSKRVLVTALRRAENPGMVWDDKRRSISDHWGAGPARIQGLRATVALPGGNGWKMEALGPDGSVSAVQADSGNTLEIDPSQKTAWWLLRR